MNRLHVRAALAVALLSICAPAGAWAEVKPRVGLDLGVWSGDFEQAGFGQTSGLAIDPAFGLQGTLGLRSGFIFLEWAPYWFVVQKVGFADRNTTDDVSYHSLWQFNVGAAIPGIPLDIYVGGGWAHWGFSTGTEAEFTGAEYKVGAAFHFSGRDEGGAHVKAEYRRMMPSYDETGTLPAEVTTTMNTFFVGIGFGT